MPVNITESQPLMATPRSSQTAAVVTMAIAASIVGSIIYSTIVPTSTLYAAPAGVTTRAVTSTSATQVLPRHAMMARYATNQVAPEEQVEASEATFGGATTRPSAASPIVEALQLPILAVLSIAAFAKAVSTAFQSKTDDLSSMDMFQTMEADAKRVVPPYAAAAVTLAALGAANGAIADPAAAFGAAKNDQVYEEAWKAVKTGFIDVQYNGVDWEQVKVNAKAKGLNNMGKEQLYTQIREDLDLLGDPFTRLMDPIEYNNIKRRLTGRLTGVGLEIAPKDTADGVRLAVQDRTGGDKGPARLAGIVDGEYLLAINGEPVDTTPGNQFEVAEKLIGNKREKVTLSMQVPGQAPRDVEVTRDSIIFQSVQSAVCDVDQTTRDGKEVHKLGYVRVPSFNYSTAAEFNKSLQDVTEAGADSLLVDLRANTGGSLNAAYEMANSVLPSGEIVRVIGSDGAITTAMVRGQAPYGKLPLTMLVNNRTASSSEVLSAALKTAGRAEIAGEQTFGKGIIQDIRTLSDGAAIFVTKERYLTPTNDEIDRVGITPTVAIDKAVLNIKSGLPTDPTAFCAAVKTAPPLFNGTAPKWDGNHPELDLKLLSAFG